MSAPASPRIALLGFNLESNRFAPSVSRPDFEERLLMSGDDIMADSRQAAPRITGTLWGFIQEMDKLGPWTPLPATVTSAGAAGPVDHDFYLEIKEDMRRRLEESLPVDGVYFSEHGAATSTVPGFDPDGDLYAMARELVGPDVPVVSTLDLHANISDTMMAATDILIGYRTNPHVDQYERGVEAAHAMRELLSGVRTAKAFIRLPLVAPQVTQLTAVGPYGEAIDRGQAMIDESVMNVSILSGFTYSDCPDNGMAFIVTTRDDEAKARRMCRTLAEQTWAERHRFVPRLTTLEDCVAGAVARGNDPSLPAAIIADVADNPGGGGRGNTTWLLESLYNVGAKDVILAVFNDRPLAAEAHERGVGATFEATFNRAEADERSRPFAADAVVRHLSDGVFVGLKGGTASEMTVNLGPTAVLQVGTIAVVVISIRTQCLDSNYFEHFGVSVSDARTVVVKSRGHFRAGFSHLFSPDQVIEADCPGLTSPNLSRFTFEGFKRPIFPLDGDASWTPPDW